MERTKTLITLDDVMKNPKVRAYIIKADEQLAALGYTEHGERHAKIVAKNVGIILSKLGYPERVVELGKIAGYLHDIGNVINRNGHAEIGALLAQNILSEMGMDPLEIGDIMMAIGNHHEEDGTPVSEMAAALIIGDKADVHRSRVRKEGSDIQNDIHDRVNYAATFSKIFVYPEKRLIKLDIKIDTKISSIGEYFEIFLSRMVLSSKAAKVLKCNYELWINEVKMF